MAKLKYKTQGFKVTINGQSAEIVATVAET